MKYVLRFLVILIACLIGYGFYMNHQAFQAGDKYVGVGVLILGFVLMPLFIFHRFKNKKIEDYMIKNNHEKDTV
jgi:hypothetical protein